MNRKQEQAIIFRREVKQTYERFESGSEGDTGIYEMVRLDRANKFFSREAYDHIGHLAIAQATGQTMRHYRKTGRTPTKLRMTVKVEFED